MTPKKEKQTEIVKVIFEAYEDGYNQALKDVHTIQADVYDDFLNRVKKINSLKLLSNFTLKLKKKVEGLMKK